VSTTTRAAGLLAFAGAVLLAVQAASGNPLPWHQQQPPRAGAGPRQVPVLLVATWQTSRDFRMTWTANGRRPPAEQGRVSPWEKEISAEPGTVVTFTVQPLIGGPGEHTCTVEEPPGHPLPGHAQQRGGGTTPIMCTATIHA
jgi:hypothetical protein